VHRHFRGLYLLSAFYPSVLQRGNDQQFSIQNLTLQKGGENRARHAFRGKIKGHVAFGSLSKE
jgi:hypothetical protein